MRNQTPSDNDDLPELQHTSVLFTFFMSIITFGIYIPYWFITRREAINNGSQRKVPFELSLLVLILFSFSLLWSVVLNVIIIPDDIMEIIVSVDRMLTLFALATIVFLSFRVRSIFKETDDHKYSKVATFFFTIWYLQHKINKHLA